MTEYKKGYLKALDDIKELLKNAEANNGGIHWGDLFIPNAHFGYELCDQIIGLKEAQANDQ